MALHISALLLALVVSQEATALAEVRRLETPVLVREPDKGVATRWYRAVCALSPMALAELKAGASDGLALQGAMEEARRASVAGSDPRERLADAAGVHRLLGFVEGRLRLATPPIWRSALRLAGQTRTAKAPHVVLKCMPDEKLLDWREVHLQGPNDKRPRSGFITGLASILSAR